VTSEDIVEHVGRLGGTPFTVQAWDIELSPDAGIGFSVLHRVRREAIARYEAVLLEPWANRVLASASLPYLPRPVRHRDPAPRLVATVSSLPAAKACLQAGCESVYVPVEVLADWDAPVPRGVVPSLPRIAHDSEIARIRGLIGESSRVQAATLGLLDSCAHGGIEVDAHWSLNALNSYTVAELGDLGAGFVWLSPELSSRQVADVAASAAVPVGIAVAGRQEVMVTEHCILMAQGRCSQRCEGCKRRQGWHFLRDRKGYSFPVRTDAAGRSHVFNSVPLDLTHALPEVLATGVSALRLDLETEPVNRAAAEVARVRQALQDTLAGREPARKDRDRVTAGHFFRGVS
jgi:putative protease